MKETTPVAIGKVVPLALLEKKVPPGRSRSIPAGAEVALAKRH